VSTEEAGTFKKMKTTDELDEHGETQRREETEAVDSTARMKKRGPPGREKEERAAAAWLQTEATRTETRKQIRSRRRWPRREWKMQNRCGRGRALCAD
jgi:hypothetical protein